MQGLKDDPSQISAPVEQRLFALLIALKIYCNEYLFLSKVVCVESVKY